MPAIQILLRGPDRTCPDCGRWLVKVKEDGRFDLAAQASIFQYVAFDLADPPDQTDGILFDAVCLRCHPEEAK